MSKIKLRFWRFVNLILIVTGAILPWVRITFDAVSFPTSPTPGWKYVLATWQEIVSRLLVYGIELHMLPFFLLGISGVLIILYLLLNLFLIIEDSYHKNGKPIAGALLGIVVILFFLILVGRPMLGYWLINLGMLSSAILEWQIPNQVRKIKK